ncbi:MAG: radical SAM protein [bacterium]
MQQSRFNIWVKDYPKKNEYLLFNTRTQALININQELKTDLDKLPYYFSSNTSSELVKNIDSLIENGIIVRDEEEEETKLNEFFNQLTYNLKNSSCFEVTVLTTYSCNFKCTYCFEESVKDPVFMDKDTSDAVVAWIIDRAEQRGLKRIHIVYYGGEPLLNIRPIYDISWNIKNWAYEHNAQFSFSIISNGSLISPGLVDKLLTVNLESIRITLDGDRRAHNSKRPFLDGRPSFDVIVNNIKNVINKVKIGIAGNFDAENIESIPLLLDYLEDEGILQKLDKIDFSPITPRLGPKDKPGSVELKECLAFIGKEGLFNEVIGIKKELMNRGINIKTGLAVNACPLIMEDIGATIDPKGVIYRCNALVGYPEFSVGNVYNNMFDALSKKYVRFNEWKKCPKDCSYVPMCQGGCRFFSYLEHSDILGLSCKREYFDRIIPELIKLEYEKIMKETSQPVSV